MKLPRMEEGAEGSKEAPANPQPVLPHHAPRHPRSPSQLSPPQPSCPQHIWPPHGRRVRVASVTVGTVILSSPVPCPSLSWEVASKKHPSSLAHLFQSVQTPHLRHKKDHFPPVKSKGQQSRAPRCPHRSQCQAPDCPSTPWVPEHCFLPGPRPRSLPGPSHQHVTLPTLFTQPLQALSGPLTGLCCDKLDSGVRDRKFKSVSLSLETEAIRQQLGTWEPALTSPGAWADRVRGHRLGGGPFLPPAPPGAGLTGGKRWPPHGACEETSHLSSGIRCPSAIPSGRRRLAGR